MPRVRSRMGCRRGNSRGRVSCQPSSTTLDPSSKALEFCFNSYLATRSGRDKGRGKFISEVCSHHSNSKMARFRFPYTLGNSSFIVSVTVELCEDIVGSGEVSPGSPQNQRMEDQNVSFPIVTSQRRDIGGSAIQDSSTHANPSAPAGEGPSSKEGQPSEFEEPDQFGYRIVEE